MRCTRFAITSVAVLLAPAAWADRVFVVCELSNSIDDKGAVTSITGKDVFVIEPKPDGSTTYTLPPGCLENSITVSASDAELTFECDHAVAEGFKYTMTLNRISGEYVKTFSQKDASGLVHYGNCVAGNPQF